MIGESRRILSWVHEPIEMPCICPILSFGQEYGEQCRAKVHLCGQTSSREPECRALISSTSNNEQAIKLPYSVNSKRKGSFGWELVGRLKFLSKLLNFKRNGMRELDQALNLLLSTVKPLQHYRTGICRTNLVQVIIWASQPSMVGSGCLYISTSPLLPTNSLVCKGI